MILMSVSERTQNNKGNTMEKLTNWYWTHGIQRGNDPTDPDRALRKISIGDWLDPILHSAERIKTLRKSLSSKSTIALWGPSQTGKSTLLSRYLDGDSPDGSDSALTWNPDTPVRFSPPEGCGMNMETIFPATVGFNPFNNKGDASGVATRYTLASDENPPDRDYPVEFRIAPRKEILHAIALGYLKECQSATVEIVRYSKDEFLKRLSEESAGVSAAPQPVACEWLRDLAEVMDRLQAEDRFNNLFRSGDWTRKVRPALVAAAHLVSNETAARERVTEFLWDGAQKLTAIFDRIEALRAQLALEWRGASKILLSPRVAALVLDIGTVERLFGGTKNYEKPDAKTMEILSRITWERDSSTGAIRVGIGDRQTNSFISGEAFGAFQAMCSELVVPVRREMLNQPSKKALLELLEKHDLLDFPGLGRKNRGSSGQSESDSKVHPDAITELQFYKNILKDGRTRCIIYGHIDGYGIDSFVVLNSALDVYPAQSDILSNGIRKWLQSFEPGWRKGSAAPLPVFLDLTFFGEPINTVLLNGVSSTFSQYATRSIEMQAFAGKETCHWFVTTYPKFCPIKDTARTQRADIVGKISGCAPFMDATGLKTDDIEAVFGEDGGTDRMLREVAVAVRPESRRARCAELLKKELASLTEAIARQLPSTEEASLDSRRASLRESAARIREVLMEIEDGKSRIDFAGLAQFMRDLFSAPRDVFDPVPRNARDGNDADGWLKEQVKHWFDDAEKRVEDHLVLDAAHQRELLCTLRDNVRLDRNMGGLGEFLRLNLGRITDHDTADAARFPFAVAFGNMLRGGTWRRISETRPGEADPSYLRALLAGLVDESSDKESSPHWKTVLEPLLTRLDDLAENAKTGARPPQPGDEQLRTILETVVKDA